MLTEMQKTSGYRRGNAIVESNSNMHCGVHIDCWRHYGGLFYLEVNLQK